MKVTVKKSSKRVDAMFDKMLKAHGKSVSAGHFADQGKHYSGLTYPELLAYWERAEGYNNAQGKFVNGPKRILAAVGHTINRLEGRSFHSLKEKWFATQNTDSFLKGLGNVLVSIEKGLIGKPSVFLSPDSTNTPLLETGDLRDKTTYRIK